MNPISNLLERISRLKRERSVALSAEGFQRVVDFGGPWGFLSETSTGWFPSQNLNRVLDLEAGGLSPGPLFGLIRSAYVGVPRHFVYLDDAARKPQWHRLLDTEGYRLGVELVVHGRTLGDIGQQDTPFAVSEADAQSGDTLRQVFAADRHSALTTTLGVPGSHTLVARLGNEPVAVACLTVHEGLAYLSNAMTLPEHRGKGAQTALIWARLRRAQDLGCDYAFSETYEWAPSSYANLTRTGMGEIYRRGIYRWENDATLRDTLVHTLEGHLPPKG